MSISTKIIADVTVWDTNPDRSTIVGSLRMMTDA